MLRAWSGVLLHRRDQVAEIRANFLRREAAGGAGQLVLARADGPRGRAAGDQASRGKAGMAELDIVALEDAV